MANVNAELNGVVWEIIVASGDDVSDGTELMILESMKMEIPVVSPVGRHGRARSTSSPAPR